MQLEQTLGMYQPMQIQRTQQRERVYNIVDLGFLSASALYTGDSGSGFGPASDLGLGPGIARKMPEAGNMIERARKDDDSPSHINYEYLVPGKKTASGKQKYINLANIHIDLED